MAPGSVFVNNRTHAVRLPVETRFPEGVKKVIVRVVGKDRILDYDLKAAAHHGDIRADLERKGKIIGDNDLHIVGHARSEAMVLVTNNLREFDRVEELRVDNWLE